MEISVYGHKVQVTDAIKEHIDSQFKKLEKFGSFITSINVVLEVRNEEHIAKCTVKVPHQHDIHAESTSTDMYNSIDSVVTKTEQQLRKVKGIIASKTHTKDPSAKLQAAMNEADDIADNHRTYDDDEDE
ncbi:ribosome-associated translation inhibitor [Xanthomonas phage XaC1]|nr:ribosome-associated translation inhibitor [Xanthomonas phage XaC1]